MRSGISRLNSLDLYKDGVPLHNPPEDQEDPHTEDDTPPMNPNLTEGMNPSDQDYIPREKAYGMGLGDKDDDSDPSSQGVQHNPDEQAFPDSDQAFPSTVLAFPGGPNGAAENGMDEYAQKVFAHHQLLESRITSKNIAIDEDFDQQKLDEIGQKVKREYDIDHLSCAEWRDQYFEYLDFALQVAEEKTYPWPMACYSLDTEILTETGWKGIADVNIGEKVISRSPEGETSYQPVSQTFKFNSLQMVHFLGKSIDLMVTPNHRMLVTSKYKKGLTSPVKLGEQNYIGFIEAGEFLDKQLQFRYIPLTSQWTGKEPDTVYGIDTSAYVRFLGWYISEGSCVYGHNTYDSKKFGFRDYGLSGGSFSIAQSITANEIKYELIKKDIEACGFTYKAYDWGFIVHARSMPKEIKDELRSLGKVYDKHIPSTVLEFSSNLLEQLLETLIMGDGNYSLRDTSDYVERVYSTSSWGLAGQIQELCQKVGLRGTIRTVKSQTGGRQIVSSVDHYVVQINTKTRVCVDRLNKQIVPYKGEVACVEVAPYHTVYVRRNGKAIWCGNSNIIFPLITTASIQFAARAYPAIINGPYVVKGVVVGTDHGNPVLDPQSGQQAVGPQGPMWILPPGAKRIRANHIAKHMSWQLLSEQKEWEADTDKMLHLLPIVGCVFRKSYFDPNLGRNCSDLITADKLVINYNAKSFETAPRITEEILLYPFEIEELIRTGLFIDQEYLAGGSSDRHDIGDDDAPIEFLEQHRRLDLDDDGYPEPYIVTVHKHTSKVARITARYDSENVFFSNKTDQVIKIIPVQYYTKYDFIPSMDGGIYGTGFGKLLSPINAAINTALNQLIDAGHLQIRGGGFIGKGLSMHTGNVRFAMGEYKAVNVTGGILRDNLVPLTFPGPSPTLFQLLGLLIEAGKEVASVKDVLSGDIAQANVPATTTMALIEQGLKVFTSIYKRVFRSLSSEFDKLYRLNSIYLPEQSSFRFGDEWHYIKRIDYSKQSGVEPVGDPSKVADAQRLGRAQFLLQFLQSPSCNPIEILNRVFYEAQIPNYEQLLVTNPPPNPAIIAKISEVASNSAKARAAEIRDIAQAINYMAQARKASDDAHLAWFDQILEGFRVQMEQSQIQGDAARTTPPPEPPKAPTSEDREPTATPMGGAMQEMPPGPGPRPPGPNMGLNHFDPLSHMPPTPSAVTPSLLQSAMSGSGPMIPPNAVRGRDGNYFIPNIRDPGKYTQIPGPTGR